MQSQGVQGAGDDEELPDQQQGKSAATVPFYPIPADDRVETEQDQIDRVSGHGWRGPPVTKQGDRIAQDVDDVPGGLGGKSLRGVDAQGGNQGPDQQSGQKKPQGKASGPEK